MFVNLARAMVFRKRPTGKSHSPAPSHLRRSCDRHSSAAERRHEIARGVSPWNSGAHDVRAAERRHESRDRAPRRSFASCDMYIDFTRLVSPPAGLRFWLSSRSRGLRPWLLWVAPSGAGEPGRAFSKSTSISRVDSTRRRRQAVPRAQFPDEPENPFSKGFSKPLRCRRIETTGGAFLKKGFPQSPSKDLRSTS